MITRWILTFLSVALLAGCNTQPQTPVAGSAKQPALPSNAEACPEPRPAKGELVACPMNYDPVCAIALDGGRKTYANGCGACTDPDNIAFTPGACPE